ncbi:MAG: hypothetical protein HQ519_03565 [Planctomycetes bacterium]|nr:hypothetical protein [Planctomycetota bacterium]
MSLRSYLAPYSLILTVVALMPCAANAQAGYHLIETEGEHQLLWGEHVILRELALKHNDQPMDFDPDLLRIQADGKRCQLSVAQADPADSYILNGTFALSYTPLVRRSEALAGGILQFVNGSSAARNCNVLLAPEVGLGLTFSAAGLDLAAYENGAPVGIRLHLHLLPQLELIDLPEMAESSAALAGLRDELMRRFADADGALPHTLMQLTAQTKAQVQHFHALELSNPEADSLTQLVNFRIGDGDAYPSQDVLLFLNSSAERRKMSVNFKDLGWDKVKMRRLAVQYPEGDCLGEIRDSLSIDVEGNGWSAVLVRKLMPRGVVATSLGPFAVLTTPWTWAGSGTAKSGVASFFASFTGPGNANPFGWMILSSADSSKTPLLIEALNDAQQKPIPFTQEKGQSWAKAPLPQNSAKTQSIFITFQRINPNAGKTKQE